MNQTVKCERGIPGKALNGSEAALDRIQISFRGDSSHAHSPTTLRENRRFFVDRIRMACRLLEEGVAVFFLMHSIP
ncbi:hypothetical protein CEXT_4351 [Caerostris extrusa]|uniref:Uncharacterized protein n=1 Tax=Caerostris extrusa TaxID=172846 RepID=A0AAV4R3E8_CAEEX|nr:hypothetical protein CEXT_4351 [Caerostris extrusa]